jgi:hypothetical protein
MNAIIDPAGVSPDRARHSQTDRDESAQPAAQYTLRRTGRKPIRFDGWQLVEAVGATVAGHVRHDLNVYQTVQGSYVVELIVRREMPDYQDLYRVKTFEDLSAAAAWLEAHPAGDDVPIPDGLANLDTALPWAVLHSVQLRQCIDRIEADYHALLSEVFAALDLVDPAEV